MAQKSVIVASGTGSAGIKQVNINLIGPTGPAQWPNWTQATTQGYPANLPTVQNVGTFTPGIENVIMANFSASAQDPATTALVAAMTTKPSAAQISVINTYIVGLKSAGIWSQLDRLWAPAAVSTLTGEANLDWINPTGNLPLSPTGSAGLAVGPLFEPGRGYIGDSGVSFVNTQFKPSVNGVNFTQNSASYWVYTLRNFQEASSSGTDPVPRVILRPWNASNQFIFGCNDGTLSTIAAGGTTSVGFFGVQRIDSGHVLGWKNGAQVGTTQAVASTGPVTNPIWVCGEDATANSGNEYAVVAIGASLAGLEAQFNTLTQAFITAAVTNVKWNGTAPVWTQSGTNYLRAFATGSTGPASLMFERTQPWSMNCVAQISTGATPPVTGILFTTVSTTPAFPGYEVWINSSGNVQVELISSVSGANLISLHDNTNWCDGKYHIFGVTYDGSSTAAGVAIYVDGVLQTGYTIVSDTLSASIIAGAQEFLIGNQANHFDYGLGGNMAFFALSSIQRSAGYMTGFTGPASTPAEDANHALYYTFAEGAGFNTKDFSTNGFTGTFMTGTNNFSGVGNVWVWR